MSTTTYDTEIEYTTGDSFGSERQPPELLGLITDNLDDAKENLRRIQEHYEKYHDSPDYGKRYSLTLLTMTGDRTISPFWVGYFEILHGAKVITIGETDMEFKLNT